MINAYLFIDREAPIVTCPTNLDVNTEPSQANATVVYTNPEVSDNSGQIPTITCDVESGSQFGIGKTEVKCQAVDSAGNQANCTFTVTVEGNDNSLFSVSNANSSKTTLRICFFHEGLAITRLLRFANDSISLKKYA